MSWNCFELEVNWALRHLTIKESVSVYKETESSLHTQKITFWRTYSPSTFIICFKNKIYFFIIFLKVSFRNFKLLPTKQNKIRLNGKIITVYAVT